MRVCHSIGSLYVHAAIISKEPEKCCAGVLAGVIAWRREGRYLRHEDIKKVPYVGDWLAEHVPRWQKEDPRRRAGTAAERRARVSWLGHIHSHSSYGIRVLATAPLAQRSLIRHLIRSASPWLTPPTNPPVVSHSPSRQGLQKRAQQVMIPVSTS